MPIQILALEDDPQNIQSTPTLKEPIKDVLTEKSPENAPMVARMEHGMIPDFPPERDPSIHSAKDAEKAIELHIQMGRYGSHEWFLLGDLGDDERECWEQVDGQVLDYKCETNDP